MKDESMLVDYIKPGEEVQEIKAKLDENVLFGSNFETGKLSSLIPQSLEDIKQFRYA